MQIPASITSKFGRQILTVRRNSPQILFVGGIASGVASTVLACKATLKLEPTITKAKVELDAVRKNLEIIEETGLDIVSTTGEVLYTEQIGRKDTAVIYTQSFVELAKLYAPAIGMGIVSIALLTKSNHILNERNAGLAAAYATIDQAFTQYRERVVEEQGELKDREYMHGVDEFEELNPETNRKRKIRGPGEASMYAKFFDETNPNFKRDPDYNLAFLHGVQNHMNNMLQATGHVFLNDVYSALGMSRTRAGSQVGWLKDEGDNYVDFGIYEGTTQTARDFVNGREGAILLDFNVDGVMWNRIDESGETNWLGR